MYPGAKSDQYIVYQRGLPGCPYRSSVKKKVFTSSLTMYWHLGTDEHEKVRPLSVRRGKIVIDGKALFLGFLEDGEDDVIAHLGAIVPRLSPVIQALFTKPLFTIGLSDLLKLFFERCSGNLSNLAAEQAMAIADDQEACRGTRRAGGALQGRVHRHVLIEASITSSGGRGGANMRH